MTANRQNTYLPDDTLGPEVLIISIYIEYLIKWAFKPTRSIICCRTFLPASKLRVLALKFDTIPFGTIGSGKAGVRMFSDGRIVSEGQHVLVRTLIWETRRVKYGDKGEYKRLAGVGNPHGCDLKRPMFVKKYRVKDETWIESVAGKDYCLRRRAQD
jgi:hypothetical protein